MFYQLRIGRLLCMGSLLLSLCTPSIASEPRLNAPAVEAQGIVERLDFGSQRISISGRSYVAAPELRVEIDGSFGAFTLLEPGMKVRLSYRHGDQGQRELLQVATLPADYPLDES